MNQTVLDLLRCPVCKACLESNAEGKVCKCRGTNKTHTYDFARSGYLYLGGAHSGEGDLKAAVMARRAFLDAGYYRSLSDAINQILDRIGASTVLDAGCGEGYYSNRMASNRAVLGIDLSRAGIDYAARRAKQMKTNAGFAVASLFDMPVADQSIDVVTNIFAPCAEQEFLRVLRPNGHLLLVGAGKRHLMGLKEAIYDTAHQNMGREDLPVKMELIEYQTLHSEINVEGKEMISALFSMTPYYWRTSEKDRAKLESLEALKTEIEFDIFLFGKGHRV